MMAITQSRFVLFVLLFGPVILATTFSCKGQSTGEPVTVNGQVGGNCEGCELFFAGMPEQINSVDTSVGWRNAKQPLLITGTVFELNGVDPASDVLIYYWQTDEQGLYSKGPGLPADAQQHGRIRGWVKSDEKGRYSIYTNRPAAYPNEQLPAHIHLFILEPGSKLPYYVDDLVFDDDPLLIPYKKKYPLENRGGSGVLRVLLDGRHQVAVHDIILGLNIPNYPKKMTNEVVSGLPVGEDQPSFIPYHAYGPDRGSRACPVCKYGRYHGLILFVGNRPDWASIRQWLVFIEKESASRQQYLKGYFVYANEQGYSKKNREKELVKLGGELGLKRVALTFVPSVDDFETEMKLNKIDASVESTLILYRHRRIVAKYIDLQPVTANFKLISDLLDKTKGDYFELPEPAHQ